MPSDVALDSSVHVTRCQFCSRLTIAALVKLAEEDFEGGVPAQREYYQHHHSFANLEQSAHDGCDLCQMIIDCCKLKPDKPILARWTAIRDERVSDLTESTSLYDSAKVANCDVRISINCSHASMGDCAEDVYWAFDTILIQVGPSRNHMTHPDDDDGSGMDPLTLRLTTTADNATQVRGFEIGRREVDPDLGSSKNFAIARDWLRDCTSKHPRCLSDHHPELPTRVIDVRPDDGHSHARLILSKGRKAPYMALSHCWGGQISTLLTSRTIDEFQSEVPYDALPLNFQDSITIARQLEIPYLWIDSLCILQDSKEDWAQESKKMGDVYRNATLTIFAIVSPGSAHGILKRNLPSDQAGTKPVSLRLFSDSTRTEEVKVTNANPAQENLGVLTAEGVLNTRGWTMQESLLSPRHLYYGNQQIYWKCPQGYNSSDGISHISRLAPDNSFDSITAVYYRDVLRYPPPALDKAVLLSDYYRLVSVYSTRSLSYNSDKLAAFSGMSSGLHKLLGGDFLAGLWSIDLLKGLLWIGGRGLGKHVLPYRAPSWSWAVTNAPITFFRETEVEKNNTISHDLQILDYQITPVNSGNPYGEIASGYITAKGLTVRILRTDNFVPIKDYRREDSSQATFDKPQRNGGTRPQEHLRWYDDDNGWFLGTFRVLHAEEQLKIDRSLIPGAELELVGLVVLVKARLQGIVLRQREEGSYERVGHFFLEHQRDDVWNRFEEKVVTLV